jgi:hypothetical protein
LQKGPAGVTWFQYCQCLVGSLQLENCRQDAGATWQPAVPIGLLQAATREGCRP